MHYLFQHHFTCFQSNNILLIYDYCISYKCSYAEKLKKTKRMLLVYKLVTRYNLTVRNGTLVSQITADATLPVKEVYCKFIMFSLQSLFNNPNYLSNMEETALFLNFTSKRTAQLMGERTMPIRFGEIHQCVLHRQWQSPGMELNFLYLLFLKAS